MTFVTAGLLWKLGLPRFLVNDMCLPYRSFFFHQHFKSASGHNILTMFLTHHSYKNTGVKVINDG